MGSHNNQILKACIIALTELYENMKILQRQLFKNSLQRKHHPQEESEDKKGAIKRQMNKTQAESEAKRKMKNQMHIIDDFMKSLAKYDILHKKIDLQVLSFRFQITKLFTENKFLKAFWQSLILVNEKIENDEPELATEFMKNLREYIETRVYDKEDIDYCEIFNHSSKKTQAVYEILWEMLTLEFTFYHSGFRSEVKGLIWMFFREVGMKECQLDDNWKNLTKFKHSFAPMFDERSHRDAVSLSGTRRHLDNDSEIMSEVYSTQRHGYGKKKSEGRHIIKLNTFAHSNPRDASASRMNESAGRSEISYGSHHRDRKRGKYYDRDADESYVDNESQVNIVEQEDYENMGWKDCCLKILDRIEEYEEAEDFKRPVTKEDLGEFWDDYRAVITYPIDLTTIRAKIYEGEYVGVGNFEFDMRKVFENCKKFNDPNSGIYDNANMLEDVFNKLFKPVKKKFGESKKLKEAGISLTIGGIHL